MVKKKKKKKKKRIEEKPMPHLWQDEIILDRLIQKCSSPSATNTENSGQKEALDFARTMMQENLAHARHVEIERLTYFGFATASCAAAFALMGDTTDSIYKIVTAIVLLIITGTGLLLTIRWSNAFKRHLKFAQGCYFLLHSHLFQDIEEQKDIKKLPEQNKEALFIASSNKTKAKEPIPGKALTHLPLYCFTIKNPDSFQILGKIRKLRTAVLFNLYYSLLIIALFVLLGIILAKPV